MSDERDIAESYRTRAEEIRMLAEMDRHEETRILLLKVADDYDSMAKTMIDIAETNELLGKV